jgi:hypothetical protein
MGADLWNYQAADGSRLKAAVEFLVPFATGERLFPYQKAAVRAATVLRWAAVVGKDRDTSNSQMR